MDMHMPLMNGLEATKAIREWEKNQQLPPCKIIALTASTVQDEGKVCQAAGMDGFIVKPVSEEQLQQALHKILQSHSDIDQQETATQTLYHFNSHFNRQKLEEVVGNESEFFQELLTLSMAEFPKNLAGLAESIKSGNSKAIRSYAHTIKGAARNMYFMRLAALAKSLEFKVKNKETVSTKDLAALEKEWVYLQAILSEKDLTIS